MLKFFNSILALSAIFLLGLEEFALDKAFGLN